MRLIEEQAVMDRVEGSEIRRLLNFKGNSRLEVKDDLTERILEGKGILLPGGIKFCFIESKKYIGEHGDWVEYKVLYSILKCNNSIAHIQYVLENASKIIGTLEKFKLDYIDLEEFDCSRAGYYYILLYIRRNIGEEIKQSEVQEIFKEYE